MVISTLHSLFITVLGPPLVLLLWAHLIRPHWSGFDLLALAIAAATGLSGIATARWSDLVKVAGAGIWLTIAIVTWPYPILGIVCTTGDCL
ncbi:MAG: hypothetical protein MT490_16115 [Sphingomonas sp.]|uniref:hypothetical protein n=1 Tax=Sphingomonas sp. TaxID=28214 RepID=UPI002275DE9F|nr:hypothetical protein [Sphingomonas sp.]MCX8477313.1 hypothetical protein [Sphingomonas sp.]